MIAGSTNSVDKIRKAGDMILKQKSIPVLISKEDIKPLIAEMTQVMKAAVGMGLAANQIGDPRAVFILDVEQNGHIEVFVNPEIVQGSCLIDFEEGCLSVPGITAVTQRYNLITLRYYDMILSEIVTKEISGTKAVAIQHEVDHLNGKLYIDQFGTAKKNLILSKSRKFQKMITKYDKLKEKDNK